MNIRNIAIIAHVDHGKTTLVDTLLKQSSTKMKSEVAAQERIMDSNDIERERGITIFSKNASIVWKGTKINIIDTPGHADFGGEVERVLTMADGVLLLVDAKEGPMPQTRFVLKKALEQGHKAIVVINKIDKKDARPEHALNATFDLFVDLGATDQQLDFQVFYASAIVGKAGRGEKLEEMTDMSPLLDAILEYVHPPVGDPAKATQFMGVSLAYDSFKGKIVTGKLYQGTLKSGQNLLHILRDGTRKNATLSYLFTFEGLERIEVEQANAGEIVAVAGVEGLNIGETLTDPQDPQPLPPLSIEEPTVKMTFGVNTSPFGGKEGEFSTSRQLKERLMRELETDVALRVVQEGDQYVVSGRGELHLAIFIERMRREGYEFQVSRPQAIMKTIDGKLNEPFEHLYIDVPEVQGGVVIQKIGARRGELKNMTTDMGNTHLHFVLPTRALFGYHNELMIDTKGLGVMNTLFEGYHPYIGDLELHGRGSLVAFEFGESNLYGLLNAQERGVLFIGPGIPVYEGMVVGENAREGDLEVNVCKTKQLSNMRSKGEGVQEHFDTPRTMGLEDALDYIGDDELVEVTPKNIRIRKQILSSLERKRQTRAASRPA
ncbi:translational GTPase TypA [Candidatus Uhrbacteria bacterium]|nr:translational GTPase TypA [Candidatus Uhrbacteria bacterium]